MAAVVSSLRMVSIYPAGANKPVSIVRVEKAVADAARVVITQDVKAAEALRELNKEDECDRLPNDGLTVPDIDGDACCRGSMESRRSGELRPRMQVGLRKPCEC